MKVQSCTTHNDGISDVTETVFENLVTLTVTLRSRHGMVTIDVTAAEPGCQPFIDVTNATVTELGKFREFAANRKVQHAVIQ